MPANGRWDLIRHLMGQCARCLNCHFEILQFMTAANIIKFLPTFHVPVKGGQHSLPAALSVFSLFYTISSHVATVSSFRALNKQHKVHDGLRESYRSRN
jgi:hypothetical protein